MKPEVYKTLEDSLILNGHTVPIKITILTMYDEYAEEEVSEDYDYSKPVPTIIHVTASALEEDYTDYLGGCLIDKLTDIDGCVSEYQMISTAKLGLIESIKLKMDLLKPYYKAKS